MIELLEICGYEKYELKRDLSRIKEVFDRVGITLSDIEHAKKRLTKYYDINLEGVRKIFRSYLREFVNLSLARDEGKTILFYGFMNVGFDIISAAFASKSKEVYAAYPAELFQMVFGNIFDKMVPLLESAEHKWLKSGAVAHCGNVKTIVGLFASDLIPQPDLLVTSDWLCDTAPKSIDLLTEFYDVPTSSYNTCQDRKGSDFSETKRITDLAIRSMKKTVRKMENIAGFEITDDDLWTEISLRNELRNNVLKTQILIENSDPVPISATHAILLHNIGKLSVDKANMPELLDATDIFHRELEQRVRDGTGVLVPGSPRVMALLPPHFADPRLEHLVGQKGIALVAAEGRFFPPDGRHIPEIDQPTNPYQAISVYLHSSILQSSYVRKSTILEACKQLNLDGLLCVSHIGCRSVAADSIIIRNSITKELGIPALLLEYESFDPRAYDESGFMEKLEVFRSMMENKTVTL